MEPTTTVIEALVDILSLSINQAQPKYDKILDAARQMKNHRHFICGKFTVEAEFDSAAPTLENNLKRLFA